MSVTLQKIFELNNGKHCSRSQDDQLIEPIQFRQNRIVSAIIFKDDQVVLVSETKHDGKWYLPAGKVKASETLHDACKRELQEESLLEGEPQHLFSTQVGLGAWFRFNFIVKQTGGHLKTFEERDRHTLEARWFPISQVVDDELDLRGKDIVPLIADAYQWYIQDRSLQREKSVVITNSYNGFCMRRIAVYTTDASSFKMAVSKVSGTVPLQNVNFDYMGKTRGYFQTNGITVGAMGLIGVEHFPVDGKDSDGICLNVLCEAVEITKDSFDWIDVGLNLSVAIKDIFCKSSFVKNSH